LSVIVVRKFARPIQSLSKTLSGSPHYYSFPSSAPAKFCHFANRFIRISSASFPEYLRPDGVNFEVISRSQPSIIFRLLGGKRTDMRAEKFQALNFPIMTFTAGVHCALHAR
jgi:hypothetical protein